MKTRKTKKFLLCVLLVVFVLSLTACDGMRLDVYEQQDEDNWYFEVDVVLNRTLVRTLESSAVYSAAHKHTWTVSDWLADYFEILQESFGFSYRYVGELNENESQVYTFVVNIPKSTSSTELSEGLSLTEGATQDVKTNLFVRTVSVARDDRFNYWVRLFNSAYDRYVAATEDKRLYPTTGDGDFKANCQSFMGSLLFGFVEIRADLKPQDVEGAQGFWADDKGNVYTKLLPGLTEAFPAVNLDAYTNVLLRNYWYASKKMNVNYDNKVGAADSDGTPDTYGVYYLFEKTVGEGDTTVEYEYYRADPTGWYLVAIAVGGLTVLIAYLVARNKKRRQEKQPPAKVQDSFPYDPFADYFNGEGNGGNDSGKIDPFA